ncbi:photosystem II protein Psb27 [Synechococcus sp. CS-1325]|uniref:photosystem II protein Psb27 n=1 Tax=unclassified Synechococcus TaxID=2626047 RepID=UPI000DB68ECA|nr:MULTISPECIES: photosystem II protein Psb27 [unclassified Synechococcus]PZV02539.1 MAG: photosystem II protein Psb27 [Cyanobium sp.]MCT0199513.1 photosystem II protein Psb27 [Synechococcus sp. CS-1325]MCT0213007.1 photosystem II protein Psb27 [Synechococcus sp. CS-1326]MCT0229835.1 photosystem II protein Psb27 [Synechococcus sp. CS-1324]MCT0232252.1 photosystem II protein Psb27 [Synechococcus sp. CS-1327]
MAAACDRTAGLKSVRAWFGGLGAAIRRPITALLAICLTLSLSLSGCGSPAGPLSGSYVDDTLTVAQTLLSTIAIAADDPGRAEAETAARTLVTGYVAYYRPKPRVNGLSSFTTMQTAINSLAGHYANYANRPLPEALRSRLEKELRKAEASVARGA